MTEEEKAQRRIRNRLWREAHPDYFAERSKQYREKFIANHQCTCLNCGAKFPGYRASYCSPECQKESRQKSSSMFIEFEKRQESRRKFEQLVEQVTNSGLKEILQKIPRSSEPQFWGLRSYIRRNDLLDYLLSIPRQIE
jgi:hypothetical protein